MTARSDRARTSSGVREGQATPLVGFGLAISAAALFAWLGPLSSWAYDLGIEPLAFVAWRAGFGTATLVVAIGLLVVRGADAVAAWRPPARQLAALGFAATMALALNLAIFGAFARVPVALALIGFYTYPAMVAVAAVLLGRERGSRAVAVALVLALGGMVIVVAGSLDVGGPAIDLFGLLLALGAAAAQTVFVLVSRDGYGRVPALHATTVIVGATLVGCVAIAIAGGAGAELAAPLREPRLLPIVLAAGVAGAAVPSLLFLTAIRRIGGTRAGILMLLEPVIGVGLAAVLLGERLGPLQATGAAAVLAAAVLLQRGAAHEAVPEDRTVD